MLTAELGGGLGGLQGPAEYSKHRCLGLGVGLQQKPPRRDLRSVELLVARLQASLFPQSEQIQGATTIGFHIPLPQVSGASATHLTSPLLP